MASSFPSRNNLSSAKMTLSSSSSPSSSSSYYFPTLSRLVALSMTYRRLLKLGMLPILLLIAGPVILTTLYWILDRWTNQHTLLSLAMTGYTSTKVQDWIRKRAPTNDKAELALKKTRIGLLVGAFGASVLLIRGVLVPLEHYSGALQRMLTLSPTISFSVYIRLAIGIELLSLIVILRFVGPPSVVRFSTSPLLLNPLTNDLQGKLSQLSLISLLESLTGPTYPYKSSAHPNTPFQYRGNARRFQQPTYKAILSQGILSAILGYAVAFTSVLPFFPNEILHGDSPYKTALAVSCVAAIIVNLQQTALDGTSHELDPLRYHANQAWKPSIVKTRVKAIGQSLFLVSFLVVSFVAVFCAIFDCGDASIWAMVGVCILTASIVTIYLYIFDDALRTILCTPPTNMKRVVEEAAGDDRMELYLDVAMCSLLHSDASLVKDLSASTKPGFSGLEREERKRNDAAIKAMAHNLLNKTSADCTGAHLEEDLLRLAISASLGGVSQNGTSFAGLDKAAAYHVENINDWLEPGNTNKLAGSRSEPLAVPLVRSLCAYVGGLGEALLSCSMQKTPTLFNTWSLPPGAIACAEYAVRAAARCIVWNFTHSLAKALSDWRSTHLSILVPVLLTSACRLEAGIVEFVRVRSGRRRLSDHLQKLELIRTECPELLPLYHACYESCSMILEKLKSLEGIRAIDFDLDHDCQRWTDMILAKIPPVAMTPQLPTLPPSSFESSDVILLQ